MDRIRGGGWCLLVLVAETMSMRRGVPGGLRTAKDFPNVSAPSAKRGDSVKFARSYATPTKKLNLRFFGYFLLIMGFIGVWGERGRGEAIEDS